MKSWLYIVLCTSHSLLWTWDCEETSGGMSCGVCWVSELCASSLNRQLGAFNMSLPLINTSREEINLSSTLSQERFTCILLILAHGVHPRVSRAALFWALITTVCVCVCARARIPPVCLLCRVEPVHSSTLNPGCLGESTPQFSMFSTMKRMIIVPCSTKCYSTLIGDALKKTELLVEKVVQVRGQWHKSLVMKGTCSTVSSTNCRRLLL